MITKEQVWELVDPLYPNEDYHPQYRRRGENSPRYFLQFGDGWNQLVYDCVTEMIASGLAFNILQIKSKFAGLRLYFTCDSESDRIMLWDIISKYETISENTSEISGLPGTRRVTPKHNWWMVLTDEEYIERYGEITNADSTDNTD